ncbi:acireductone synthase [Alishewanella sp. HL-SH05]|uniref:acireductone synthase n=1 Tax=Alishewanella sp. HL-SH05 TaxID=3461145 RepID=UPI004040EA55
MTYSAIITDIEGTTTRISFVTEVLFPYARLHLAAFVRQHQQQPAVLAELTAVREQLQQPEADVEQCISALLSWLDADQKITPLKSLQGMIWQEGYQQGHFTGHLYPDAVAQLQTWQQRGIPLYIYSSGSVTAQQLLFKNSNAGDLTPLLSGYFDTRIGGKRDLASYQAILKQLQLPPAQVLFLSDVVAELDAARQAGMATVQLIREQQAASDHPVAENFYQIEV